MGTEVQGQIKNIAIIRQRNFFAGCMALALGANFLLSSKLATSTEKLIMVPGIAQEMSVDNSRVSQGYLEETSLLFISALLDLTPSTVESKKEIILKYASLRSSQALRSLQEYFANVIAQHQKFQLSTFFAPKKLHVDSKNLQVIVQGVLTSTFGKRGFEEREVKYRLSFDYIGGHLMLKEFVELKPKEQQRAENENNERSKKVSQ